MHSFHGNSANIFHNGDYSGDVKIMKDGISIDVDMEDIIDFVAGYVRDEKIRELEQTNSKDLLLKR